MVTGGAGFIGSHLVDALVNKGAKVSIVDNLSTGKETTIYQLYKKTAKLLGKPDAEPKFCPDRSGEMYSSQLDNGKAKKYFKWQQMVDLDEGLKKLWISF